MIAKDILFFVVFVSYLFPFHTAQSEEIDVYRFHNSISPPWGSAERIKTSDLYGRFWRPLYSLPNHLSYEIDGKASVEKSRQLKREIHAITSYFQKVNFQNKFQDLGVHDQICILLKVGQSTRNHHIACAPLIENDPKIRKVVDQLKVKREQAFTIAWDGSEELKQVLKNAAIANYLEEVAAFFAKPEHTLKSKILVLLDTANGVDRLINRSLEVEKNVSQTLREEGEVSYKPQILYQGTTSFCVVATVGSVLLEDAGIMIDERNSTEVMAILNGLGGLYSRDVKHDGANTQDLFRRCGYNVRDVSLSKADPKDRSSEYIAGNSDSDRKKFISEMLRTKLLPHLRSGNRASLRVAGSSETHQVLIRGATRKGALTMYDSNYREPRELYARDLNSKGGRHYWFTGAEEEDLRIIFLPAPNTTFPKVTANASAVPTSLREDLLSIEGEVKLEEVKEEDLDLWYFYDHDKSNSWYDLASGSKKRENFRRLDSVAFMIQLKLLAGRTVSFLDTSKRDLKKYDIVNFKTGEEGIFESLGRDGDEAVSEFTVMAEGAKKTMTLREIVNLAEGRHSFWLGFANDSKIQ